jgi:hypothetical protein
MDDLDAKMIGFRENLRRKVLTSKQRTRYIAELTELMEQKYGKPQVGRPPVNAPPRYNSLAETAKLADTSKSTVRREQDRLDPAKFCHEVREAVEAGSIKPASADELKSLSLDQQRILLPEVIGIGRDDIRKLVKSLKAGGEPATPTPKAQQAILPSESGQKPSIPTIEKTVELFAATKKAAEDMVQYGRMLLAGGHVDRLTTNQRSTLSLHLEMAQKVIADLRAERKLKLAIVDDADRLAA